MEGMNSKQRLIYQEDRQLYFLVCMHGLNIEAVYAYTGRVGYLKVVEHFEAYTGVPYEEYQQRRQRGEDNHEVLPEDEEGTEIYVLEPAGSGKAEGGTALWQKKAS